MYIDTSALAKLYIPEPESEAVQKAVEGHTLVSSELVIVEFTSVIARKLREKAISKKEAKEVLELFHSHVQDGVLETVKLESSVLAAAAKMLFDCPASIPLRTLDAIHLGACKGHSLFPLLTLDKVMLLSACYYGIPITCKSS